MTGDPKKWIEESDENGGTLYIRGLGLWAPPKDTDFSALEAELATLCKPFIGFSFFHCKLADAPPAEFAYLFTKTPHTMLGEEARANGRKLLGPRELNEKAKVKADAAKEKAEKAKERAEKVKFKADGIEAERERRNNAEPKWFLNREHYVDFTKIAPSLHEKAALCRVSVVEESIRSSPMEN